MRKMFAPVTAVNINFFSNVPSVLEVPATPLDGRLESSIISAIYTFGV
jgi:hypothetical protein